LLDIDLKGRRQQVGSWLRVIQNYPTKSYGLCVCNNMRQERM
jgi:hypothetical protein